MPYDTTLENLTQRIQRIANAGKGEIIYPLKARRCTNCQGPIWSDVVKTVGDRDVIRYAMRVVTRRDQSMPGYAQRNFLDLLIAICARAEKLKESGNVMAGHAELMQAVAERMPELNADLHQVGEDRAMQGVDPIHAIA